MADEDGLVRLRRIFAALALWLALIGAASAQQSAFVQIEAQRSLASATDTARGYAARLENVTGFALSSGWYAIALGPYTQTDAERLLRDLRAQGRIPGDSYVVAGSTFRQQFWPIGVGAPVTPQPLPGTVDAAPPDATEAALPRPEPDPIRIPDESPAQARASEASLTRGEREELQIALQWAGFYQGAIDAAFGRGTRGAMRAWQEANNHEPTGVLTSGQRVELIAAYNAVLEGMDLQLVQDDASGIRMQVPTGVVEFSEYEPPFVRFDARSDDLPAQVLLISQEGGEDRFFGLYEILQTLEIVPLDGPRQRNSTRFTIEGTDATRATYVEARLAEGTIKGFALIWPAGDEERRTRVLATMRESFETLPGALDPAIAPPGEDQAIDLIAGLDVRRPDLSRSGFFLNGGGDVLTTAEAVAGCDRITLDSQTDATVAHLDEALGIAVLRPQASLAPIRVAEFQTGVPRLQSSVAVSGFPYGGILSAPTVTFGTLADLRGLEGEEEIKRLTLAAQPGDAGGPLFDNGGAVLGMLLPREDRDGRVLPGDVSFAADAEAILASLETAGVDIRTTDNLGFLPPESLTERAAEMTVLVSCW